MVYPTLTPKMDVENEHFTSISNEFSKRLESDICIVIGFSFRDDYIKKQFQEFLEMGKVLMIFSHDAKVINNLLKIDDRGLKKISSIREGKYVSYKDNIFLIKDRLSQDSIQRLIQTFQSIINSIEINHN